MKMFRLVLLLSLCLIPPAHAQEVQNKRCLLETRQEHADTPMDLVLDRQGIKVWTYEIPHYPIRGFKAVTTVTSSLSALINLIMDTENAPSWVYHVNRINVLQRNDAKQTFALRVEMNFWPLKDRDVYVNGTIAQDPLTHVVTILSQSAAVGAYPEQKGFVRMPDMLGCWQFKPLGRGEVEVTMSGRADPGGLIPDFLVNMLIQESPYNSLLGLRESVGADKYQQARLRQIRELPEQPLVAAENEKP